MSEPIAIRPRATSPRPSRCWLVMGVLLVCFASQVQAATEQSKSIFSSGGQRSSNGSVTLDATLGDVMSGISQTSGGGSVIEHGFWSRLVASTLDANGGAPPILVDALGAAVPNPARTHLLVSFSLSAEGRVSLTVHDLAGREIRDLSHGTRQAGVHRAAWDLRSSGSQRVPAGVYFLRLSVDGALAGFRRLAVLD